MSGNVTVDPASLTRPAADLQIEEVVDLLKGRIWNVRRLIAGHRYDRFIQLRNKVRERMHHGDPTFACYLCGTPVYLVGRQDKSFFFRHAIEDGSCAAITKDGLSLAQYSALKYQGACESKAHQLVKERIARSLRADQRFTAVGTEITWPSLAQPGRRRRPDVSAVFKGMRIAFEAQLSTTFLDVVVGRRAFYKQEGGLLVWILPLFQPSYRRITDDDVLMTNNSNVLVVDDETVALSEATGKFMLRCHYREPFLGPEGRTEAWRSHLVEFGELTADQHEQRVFWFDFDAADGRVSDLLSEAEEARKREEEEEASRRLAKRAERLRSEIYQFWEAYGGRDPAEKDPIKEWQALRDKLSDFGVQVPDRYWHDDGFSASMTMILSAKEKRAVGTKHHKLIQVAHNILEHHKPLFRLFHYALKVYGSDLVVQRQDHSRKWEAKLASVRPAIEELAPEYGSDRTWHETLAFLFPELAAQIGKKRVATRTPAVACG